MKLPYTGTGSWHATWQALQPVPPPPVPSPLLSLLATRDLGLPPPQMPGLTLACAALPPPCLRSTQLAHLAETGDRPGLETNLPKEAADEMKSADKGQVVSMSEKPWWDWDEEKQVGRGGRTGKGW